MNKRRNIREIRAMLMLLREWPQQQVACTTGLAANVVRRLARRVREMLRTAEVAKSARPCSHPLLPVVEFVKVEFYDCEGCGKRVRYSPCVICAAREGAGQATG